MAALSSRGQPFRQASRPFKPEIIRSVIPFLLTHTSKTLNTSSPRFCKKESHLMQQHPDIPHVAKSHLPVLFTMSGPSLSRSSSGVARSLETRHGSTSLARGAALQLACVIFPLAQRFPFANHTVLARLSPVDEPSQGSHRHGHQQQTGLGRIVGPPRSASSASHLGPGRRPGEAETMRIHHHGCHNCHNCWPFASSAPVFRRCKAVDGSPAFWGRVAVRSRSERNAVCLDSRNRQASCVTTPAARAPPLLHMWLKPESATWDREGEGSAP
jgi:hypothetical protein